MNYKQFLTPLLFPIIILFVLAMIFILNVNGSIASINNVVTGEFKWPVADGKNEKVKALKELCNKLNINLNEVAYVGDNYNDIGAFKIVGLAIAFNSEEEEVKKYAKIVIDKKDLREILNFF